MWKYFAIIWWYSVLFRTFNKILVRICPQSLGQIIHLPLNFHFPDTNHVKHIKYIYFRYPWDPKFHITEKENIPIGTITTSSLKLHTDKHSAFHHILAIQYNGVTASPEFCPLRFAYQTTGSLAYGEVVWTSITLARLLVLLKTFCAFRCFSAFIRL